jgi:ureidoglycolate dehydrogenase (NAD+)
MATEISTVQASDLERMVADVFERRGMDPRDAGIVAQTLVWADLRGHPSHGVSRVSHYLTFIERGDLDPKARPRTVLDGGAIFQIDAQRSAGAIALQGAVEHAAGRATEHGVTLGIVSRTTHIGAAGFFANQLAARGMIGIVASAGIPLMAYPGTAVASVSTAPIAIAAPSLESGMLVLDMATSVVALGKIKQAALSGRSIPEGWALDGNGLPTTDPHAAKVQLPLGGPKGGGLALMLEIVAGLLGGAAILAPALSSSGGPKHSQNALVMAIDIARFRDLDDFGRDVDSLVKALKALPLAGGIDTILMPGERGERTYRERLERGVPVPRKLMSELQDLRSK